MARISASARLPYNNDRCAMNTPELYGPVMNKLAVADRYRQEPLEPSRDAQLLPSQRRAVLRILRDVGSVVRLSKVVCHADDEDMAVRVDRDVVHVEQILIQSRFPDERARLRIASDRQLADRKDVAVGIHRIGRRLKCSIRVGPQQIAVRGDRLR